MPSADRHAQSRTLQLTLKTLGEASEARPWLFSKVRDVLALSPDRSKTPEAGETVSPGTSASVETSNLLGTP